MGRAVAIIVVAGTVLGLAHNEAGRLSRPSRGIPWLAKTEAPVDLETLVASAGTAAAGEAGAPVAGAAARDTISPGQAGTPRGTEPPGSRQATSAGPSGRGTPAPAPPPKTASEPAATPAQDPPPAAAGPSTPETPPAAPVPFIPESDRPIQVKVATVRALLDAGAALFLDARDPEEYEAGHIPGALRLTREDALSEPDRVKALPVRGRPIVTYCAGGACEASLELAQVLVEAGYRRVLVYTGGFPEWVAAGHPVERGSGAP